METSKEHPVPAYIKDIESLLSSHTTLIDVKQSLHLFFNRTDYGCVKDYPVAIVHESKRIKEKEMQEYFTSNYLLNEEGFSYEEYGKDDLEHMIHHAPNYIQTVGFMLSTSKEMPHPTFFNKFKGDYWKKIQSVEGLEAVIDMSTLTEEASSCEVEDELRSIIRKRKEVHQLKKLGFVWIVEVNGENRNVTTVMKHYFNANNLTVKNGRKTYYVGWSIPLKDINMRYFVCPPA